MLLSTRATDLVIPHHERMKTSLSLKDSDFGLHLVSRRVPVLFLFYLVALRFTVESNTARCFGDLLGGRPHQLTPVERVAYPEFHRRQTPASAYGLRSTISARVRAVPNILFSGSETSQPYVIEQRKGPRPRGCCI